MGVGHGACWAAQVPIPQGPWLREFRVWGPGLGEQWGVPSEGQTPPCLGLSHSATPRKRTKAPGGPSPFLGTSVAKPASAQPLHHGTEKCPGPACSPPPQSALQGARLAGVGSQTHCPKLSS